MNKFNNKRRYKIECLLFALHILQQQKNLCLLFLNITSPIKLIIPLPESAILILFLPLIKSLYSSSNIA